jgi:hypothetical protein
MFFSKPKTEHQRCMKTEVAGNLSFHGTLVLFILRIVPAASPAPPEERLCLNPGVWLNAKYTCLI